MNTLTYNCALWTHSHAHTLSAPHMHTYLSVLTCPLYPIYPSSLLYTLCACYMCMYVVVYLLCVCAFLSDLGCPGNSFTTELFLPPTLSFTHTHTRFPCSMVSSYSSGTLLVLAAKLVAVMDAFFSESRIQIKIGYNTGGQFTDQCYTL